MFIFRPLNIRQIVVPSKNKRMVRILGNKRINNRHMRFISGRRGRGREICSRDNKMTGPKSQTYK